MKAKLIKGIMNWVEACLARPDSSYSIQKLSDNNIDIANGLEKMTQSQLRIVMALCAACYNKGCGETREWFKNHRETTEATVTEIKDNVIYIEFKQNRVG